MCTDYTLGAKKEFLGTVDRYIMINFNRHFKSVLNLQYWDIEGPRFPLEISSSGQGSHYPYFFNPPHSLVKCTGFRNRPSNSTHLLTVSESPITHKWRLGRVIATICIPHQHANRILVVDGFCHRSIYVSPLKTLLHFLDCFAPDLK